MRLLPKLFSYFILIFTPLLTKAEWKQWMNGSDVIAFVEFSRKDEQLINAKIIKCYKGSLQQGSEITVWGLENSDRSGLELLFKSRYILCLSEKQQNTYEVIASASVVMNRVECNLFKYSDYQTLRTTSLKQFDSFLEAYMDSTKRPQVCNKIVKKLHFVDDAEKATLWLMQLYILDYNQYHDVFKSCLIYPKNSTRYALLKLMGNIHTDESRKIISAYIYSNQFWIVGLAIEALGNEPPEKVGPFLLEQFKIWKNKGLKADTYYNTTSYRIQPKNEFGVIWDEVFGATYASNGDSPQFSRGQWEVINAFGKLKYKPAIPELLKFVDECDDYNRIDVLNAIKNIDEKEYIQCLNRMIDSKKEDQVSFAFRKILRDSLSECLPSLMNYVHSIDRNANCKKSFIVSRSSGLGMFGDSVTRNFLITDFKNFQNFDSDFKCSNKENWYLDYISTFKAYGVDCARSAANEYLFKTYGLNEDFAKSPSLFQLKKDLEEAAILNYQKILKENGYDWLTITEAVAYIENTHEVMEGKEPRAHYAILSDLNPKKTSWDMKESAQIFAEILHNELRVSIDSISISVNNYIYSDYRLPDYGWYYNDTQSKIYDWASESARNFDHYVSYLLTCRNVLNADFFQGLLDFNYIISKPERALVEQTISDLQEVNMTN